MAEHIAKIHSYLGGEIEKHYSLKTAASENGKTFRIEFADDVNRENEKVCCIKIDKGIIPKKDTSSKKCDFLFYHGKIEDYHFVELKGQDISQAVEQIKATVLFVKEKLAEKRSNFLKKPFMDILLVAVCPKKQIKSIES